MFVLWCCICLRVYVNICVHMCLGFVERVFIMVCVKVHCVVPYVMSIIYTTQLYVYAVFRTFK